MARLTLLAGLLATLVTAVRAEPPVPGFTYIGCVKAVVKQFDTMVDFFKAPRSEECVTACGGRNSTYAALGAGCRCRDAASEEPVNYQIVDESFCPVMCIQGDESAGHCGGELEDGHDEEYFNLYRKTNC